MDDMFKVLMNAYLAGEYCGQPPVMMTNGTIVVYITTEDGEEKLEVRK
jgi:NADH:ubiquinone oxidoreductase subunit E